MADKPKESYFVNVLNQSARGLQDASINFLKNLPEPIKSPIRQAIGRIATNVITPVGYVGEHQSKLQETRELFTKSRLPDTISSIIKDEPVYPQDALVRARSPLFREFFDLPRRDTENVYTNVGKQFRINPETKNVPAQDTLRAFKGNEITGSNQLSGTWNPGVPDPWDFDLHPDELQKFQGRPLDTTAYVRQALQAIGKPAVLQTGGYVNPPPNEMMYASRGPKSYFPSANDYILTLQK